MNTKLLLVLLFFVAAKAMAQTPQEQSADKVKQAIKLEDAGNIDDAIKLLEEAVKQAPDDITNTYELAYAWYMKGDYNKAASYLEAIKKDKHTNERVYQLLGNCYDILGKSSKALDLYAEGLKKFPGAGRLYLETGVVLMAQKDYNKALFNFEKGVEVDPLFPSNYYWAGKLFLGSDEKVWGMIYGEMFMNLERNSKRTVEMSKLLYDTYKSQITFPTDTSMAISFSKNNIMTLDDIKKKKLPYGTMVYEMATSMAVTGVKSINLNSLDTLRTNFVNFYFQKFNKDYPNVLFSYQNEMITSGQFEAYNHWLLMKGDETAFTAWQANNKDKWDAFVKWYTNNTITLSNEHRFYRAQYN